MPVSAGENGETLQTFCEAVWQSVAKQLTESGKESLLSKTMTRMDALYYASQLWIGDHPECERLNTEDPQPIKDRVKAEAIVLQDVLREAAKYETVETAEV